MSGQIALSSVVAGQEAAMTEAVQSQGSSWQGQESVQFSYISGLDLASVRLIVNWDQRVLPDNRGARV